MALAETQTLEVLLKFSTSGQGNISKVESELKGMSTAAGGAVSKTAAAEKGVSSLSKAATGLGGALSHAKGAIGELVTGPLGLIGLGVGLFTAAGAFEAGIGKAEDMALAVEKLTGVTGLGTHAASQYLAVFEKFGIAGDQTVKIAGFAEKALGKLEATQAHGAKSAALLALEEQKYQIQLRGGSVKLVDIAIKQQTLSDKLAITHAGLTRLDQLDQQYGLHLKDAKGHVVDFGSELGQVADFYNSNASASDKATVAAQLFGRGYVSLIPVLKLGSAGIKEAAAEADKLGLTLKNAQDVKNVHDFIAAQREAKDALAGLEIQLGLLVMPQLVPAFKTFTQFVITNKGQILQFFKDAIGFGKQVAGAVISIGSAFVHAWNAIPPGFRQLIIEGLVANKALKFTFGFDPLKIAEGGIADAVKGLVSGFFGRGSPANPMFVVQEGGLGGGIGGAGAAAAGGGLSAAGLLTAGVLGLGVAAAFKILVLDPQLNAAQQDVALKAQRQLNNSPTSSAVFTGIKAIEQGIRDIHNTPGGDQLFAGQLTFLTNLLAIYQKKLSELDIHGPSATQRQKNDDPHLNRGLPRPLTPTDLQKAAIEGNRNAASHHDVQNLNTNIGLNLWRLKSGVESTYRSESQAIVHAIFQVVGAIQNISFPTSVGGVQQLHNRPAGSNGGAAYKASGTVGTEGNRGYVNLSVTVHPSARQNDHSQVVQMRYGPTPARAGAQ